MFYFECLHENNMSLIEIELANLRGVVTEKYHTDLIAETPAMFDR